MILTKEEADSLLQAQCSSPHSLLGMHKLGNGGGVVIRAFAPDASEVEAVPTLEKDKPSVRLRHLRAGLFEGAAKASDIYAYDLVITGADGKKTQLRDGYSFLPTLGDTDLYLFGQGNEHRIY